MRKITIEFIVQDEHGDAALNGILDDFLGSGFPEAEVRVILEQPTVVSGEHGGCLVRAGKTPRQDGRLNLTLPMCEHGTQYEYQGRCAVCALQEAENKIETLERKQFLATVVLGDLQKKCAELETKLEGFSKDGHRLLLGTLLNENK